MGCIRHLGKKGKNGGRGGREEREHMAKKRQFSKPALLQRTAKHLGGKRGTPVFDQGPRTETSWDELLAAAPSYGDFLG